MIAGSIRISTRLDTKDVAKDLGALEKMIDRTASNLAKATAKMTADPAKGVKPAEEAAAAAGAAVSAMEETIRKLKDEMDALGTRQIKTEDFAELEKKAQAAEQAVFRLYERQDKMRATGVSESSRAWQNLQYDIQAAEQRLKDYEADMTAMQGNGDAYLSGVDTQAYAELANRLAEAQRKLDGVRDAQKDLNAATEEYRNKSRSSFGDGMKAADSLKQSIAGAASRVVRFSMTMLSVRSVYALLRKAASAYLADNEALTAKISAAWSALGQMLGPVIEFIVNLFLKAIAVINAFVQALSGINFLAKANARALNKQAGATAGAGAAAAKAEKQLASFDEQNKLSDSSGGGGGGGGGAGGADLGLEFDQDFLDKLEWVQDHAKDILWYVGAIAAGLLAWKIASAFGASLGKCAGLAAAIGGSIVYVKGFLDAFNNGPDWQNVSEMLGGLVTLALGLYAAFGPAAAAVGLLVGGIGLLVVGIKDFIETGELSEPAFAAIEGGILAIGAAISLLTGNWIPVVIAAVGGLVLAVVTHWDQIKAAIGKAWQWISDKLSGIVSFIRDKVIGPIVDWYNSKIKPVVDAVVGAVKDAAERLRSKFGELMDWLEQHVVQPVAQVYQKWVKPTIDKIVELVKKMREIVAAVFQALWNKIKEIFTPVVSWFREKFTAARDAITKAFSTVGSFFSGVWSGVKTVFANVTGWFREKFSAAWQAIKDVFKPFGSFFSGLWDTIKTTFSALGTSIGNAIGGAVKSGINGVISLIENTVNGAIRIINGAIRLINKLPGVHVGGVGYLSLPRLARGGIVNNPGRGVPLVAGEAGREAILPLDNNTGWMDVLAEKVRGSGGEVVIPIYLSGKEIARYVVSLNDRRAFAANGG